MEELKEQLDPKTQLEEIAAAMDLQLALCNLEVGRVKKLLIEMQESKGRLKADYEKKERFAYERILREIIVVLDSFDAAIAAGSSALEDGQMSAILGSSFGTGINLVYKQLLSVLKPYGFMPMSVIGQPFNPELHEALRIIDSDKFPKNHIVDEYRKGYLLHERVLRPAQVAVCGVYKEKVDND